MKSGGHEMAPRTPPLRIDRAFSSIALAATVFTLGLWPAFAWGQAGDANAGKAVYERKCLLCHGEKGDGKGPAAELLDPKPRDFTSGIYKIRTTAGKAPSDQDLYRVISDGMPGTSMPSWAVLPEKDRWNVVAYVKAFAADKFKEATKKQELPKDVASSADSIKRGKEMFEAIECNKCHGTEGRADGPRRPRRRLLEEDGAAERRAHGAGDPGSAELQPVDRHGRRARRLERQGDRVPPDVGRSHRVEARRRHEGLRRRHRATVPAEGRVGRRASVLPDGQ